MPKPNAITWSRYVMTDAEVIQAAALWAAGLDTYDIAQKLRVHESAIANRLNAIRGARK